MEVDAKYIKDMLNNPNLVPFAAVNRWIAGIMLFSFKLRHVSATEHGTVDGLSRRPQVEEDPTEDPEEAEDFIDERYAFHLALVNAYGTGSAVGDGEGHTDNNGGVELPAASAMTAAHEEKLRIVRDFLSTLRVPEGLSKAQTKQLARLAAKYFVKNGRLWRVHSSGTHQQYVEWDQRLHILREAHDKTGHKGWFTVRAHLASRFR